MAKHTQKFLNSENKLFLALQLILVMRLGSFQILVFLQIRFVFKRNQELVLFSVLEEIIFN